MRIELNEECEDIALKNIYGDCLWTEDLNGNQYTDIHAIILSQDEHEQIVLAQNQIVALLHETQRLIKVDTKLNEWLGIPECLHKLANVKVINALITYGRFDWMFGVNGELNLLEFNSETPMGWKESCEYTMKAHQYFSQFTCKNASLETLLQHSIESTLQQYGNKGRGRIAIVGDLCDIEENDTFKLLTNVTKRVNEEVIMCSVSELKLLKGYDDIADGVYVERGDTLLPIDVLQTFYSVEWMAEDEGGKELIEFIEKGIVKLMNPVSTLQIHSKGIYALIWFLLLECNMLQEHKETIWKYIPYATFDSSEFEGLENKKFVAKPLNHREGDGIEFNVKHEEDDSIVYQEFVDSFKLLYPRKKFEKERELVYTIPTIGTYCIGDKFGGYMSRLTETICSAYDSTFVPTFVE